MAHVMVGDVVASRRFRDPAALVDGLARVLDRVNAHVAAVQPLVLVVRDEFHAAYAHTHLTLQAALRLRLFTDDLRLATVDGPEEAVDVRIGLGSGVVVTGAGGSQTGDAWWRASDAKRDAQELATRSRWPPSLRTVHRGDDPRRDAEVNGYLLLQDQLLARMDASDRRALRGLLDDERQVDIAADLGVSQPAVARRVRDRGALAIARALAQWAEAEAGDGPAPTDTYPSAEMTEDHP